MGGFPLILPLVAIFLTLTMLAVKSKTWGCIAHGPEWVPAQIKVQCTGAAPGWGEVDRCMWQWRQ